MTLHLSLVLGETLTEALSPEAQGSIPDPTVTLAAGSYRTWFAQGCDPPPQPSCLPSTIAGVGCSIHLLPEASTIAPKSSLTFISHTLDSNRWVAGPAAQRCNPHVKRI